MKALTYEPDTTIARSDCIAPATARRCECPVCGKAFGYSAAVMGDVEWSDDHGCQVALIKLFCDGCSRIYAARFAIEHGQPVRMVDSCYAVIRKPKKVQAFLAKHPQALGVEQS